MKRTFFFLFFLTISTTGFGQAGQQPFFKEKADSLHYAGIQALFSKWAESRSNDFAGMPKKPNYDSLNKVLREVLEKAEWRWVYKPKTSYTSFTDLKTGNVNPKEVTRLSISSLKAEHVPKEVLLCKNLEELELVNTQIDKLQEELNSLTQLSSIYLYNNVPSGRLVLEENDHVNYLRIAGHHPNKLPKSYKNFTSLDSLNINRSMATRIPNVQKNKELTIINAVSNNITLKGSKKNKILTHLDLRMNKVTKVPNSISRKYPNLKALSFNANPVIHQPQATVAATQ